MKELRKKWSNRQLPRLRRELQWRLDGIADHVKVAKALEREIKRRAKEEQKS